MEFDNTIVALLTALLCFIFFFMVTDSNRKKPTKRRVSASSVLKKGIKTVKKRQAAKANPASSYKPKIIPKGYTNDPTNGDLVRKNNR